MHLSNSVSAPVSPQQIPVQQKQRRPSLYLKLGEEGGREGVARLGCWLGMAVHLAAHAKCLQ